MVESKKSSGIIPFVGDAFLNVLVYSKDRPFQL